MVSTYSTMGVCRKLFACLALTPIFSCAHVETAWKDVTIKPSGALDREILETKDDSGCSVGLEVVRTNGGKELALEYSCDYAMEKIATGVERIITSEAFHKKVGDASALVYSGSAGLVLKNNMLPMYAEAEKSDLWLHAMKELRRDENDDGIGECNVKAFADVINRSNYFGPLVAVFKKAGYDMKLRNIEECGYVTRDEMYAHGYPSDRSFSIEKYPAASMYLFLSLKKMKQ